MMIDPAIQAERKRCAELCERMAAILDESAAKLREEGAYSVSIISLKWPFIHKERAVMPGWERTANLKEQGAVVVRAVKSAILEGWEPKP